MIDPFENVEFDVVRVFFMGGITEKVWPWELRKVKDDRYSCEASRNPL